MKRNRKKNETENSCKVRWEGERRRKREGSFLGGRKAHRGDKEFNKNRSHSWGNRTTRRKKRKAGVPMDDQMERLSGEGRMNE